MFHRKNKGSLPNKFKVSNTILDTFLNNVLPRLERPLTIMLTRFLLVEMIHYKRKNNMKAYYYTILVNGDLSIQGDVLIEESALKEVVRYLGSLEKTQVSYISNAIFGISWHLLASPGISWHFLAIR